MTTDKTLPKWCSYCRKADHNDSECWCTRPAGWTAATPFTPFFTMKIGATQQEAADAKSARIAELEAQVVELRAGGWISVKDRLPDDPKQQCLVYWGMSFDVPLYGVATLSDKWKSRLLWRGHGGAHVDVTHWKPIAPPQQPQEDGK